MQKKLNVYIEGNLAAVIAIEIKDDYVDDVGTTECLSEEIKEFVSSIIQRNSFERNLQ